MTHSIAPEYLQALLATGGKDTVKGKIRSMGRCPECNSAFIEVKKLGFICPNCKKLPERFMLDLPIKGKRYRIYSDKSGLPLDSYQRAQALLTTINAEITEHKFDPTRYMKAEIQKYWASTLLTQFLSFKLDASRRECIAPSYQKDYTRMVNIAKDYWKTKDMRDIRKVDLSKYKEHIEKTTTLKGKSIKNILDLFKTFMRYLKDELEIIDSIPSFPKVDVEPSQFAWLNAEDQRKLFDLIPSEHKPVIAFMMLHGCRPSEARALRCKDIDLSNGCITIKSTFSNGVYRERRKGRMAKPVTLPIHPEMLGFLTERVKGNLPEAYIFHNPSTGSYYRETYLRRLWGKVKEQAGITKALRLYDATRHSFASQLINNNVPLYSVSKLLGHSSIKTTEKYAHTDLEGLRANMEKLSLTVRELSVAQTKKTN